MLAVKIWAAAASASLPPVCPCASGKTFGLAVATLRRNSQA